MITLSTILIAFWDSIFPKGLNTLQTDMVALDAVFSVALVYQYRISNFFNGHISQPTTPTMIIWLTGLVKVFCEGQYILFMLNSGAFKQSPIDQFLLTRLFSVLLYIGTLFLLNWVWYLQKPPAVVTAAPAPTPAPTPTPTPVATPAMPIPPKPGMPPVTPATPVKPVVPTSTAATAVVSSLTGTPATRPDLLDKFMFSIIIMVLKSVPFGRSISLFGMTP
jgi:hypothetical protein